VAVTIPVDVTGASGETCKGEIRDISVASAMIASGRALGAIGETVRLRFALIFAEAQREFTLTAEIRNASNHDATAQRTGVHFSAMDEEDRRFVLSCVYEQLFMAREGLSYAGTDGL
jgi:c-di-GMP-binding flagellar brake protein YcgR